MINLGRLIDAVQRNCDIADARFARDMTMCDYLLDMREFYRWEHELPYGAEPSRGEVSAWLAAREAHWEVIAEDEYGALPIAEERCDPFAAAAANRVLAPLGFVYGAGIGRFGRPHFFLGRLAQRLEADGLDVVVSGCEYARDLAAIPAALQGGTVFVRREALRQWLRGKAEAWGVKQVDGLLRRALAAYGWFDDPVAALERMVDAEIDTLILHERGEDAAGRMLGPAWEEMLSGFAARRAEVLARAVRDDWADCLVTLPTLVERRAWASLDFWFAGFDGMRREIFPRLATAGERWAAARDAPAVLEAAAAGAAHWQSFALRLLELHRRHGGRAGDEIAALTRDIGSFAL